MNKNKNICEACEKKDCKNCKSSFTCKCECRVNGVLDITQKGLSILGGVGAVAGGLALSIGTGGLGAVFAGSALMGAGISSVYQGVEKSIKKARMSAIEYCGEVALGVVTGFVTGGVGAASEVVVGRLAIVGTRQLAIRAGTGAVSGIATKTASEVKACSTGEKEWSEFGKAVDKNGNQTVVSTAASWTTSAVVGSLGGAASHFSSNVSSMVNNNIAKATTRVAISGTAACTADAVSQGINIAAGNQEEYSIKQTVLSGTASAVTSAAMEGMKSGIYAANGGKENLIEDKSDKLNKKIIEEKVPIEDIEPALKAYHDLKDVPNSEMKTEIDKANSGSGYKEINHLGESHAHPLTGNKVGQIAVDVGEKTGSGARGPKRIVFDYCEKPNGGEGYSVSGYTADHNYNDTPGPGQQENVYKRILTNLNVSENAADIEQKMLNTAYFSKISGDEDKEEEDSDCRKKNN